MSLFLKQSKFQNGKTFLSIVDGYRMDGKVKQKVYQKLGYLDDLKKEYDDPVSHYKSYVEELKKEFSSKITTTFDLTIPDGILYVEFFSITFVTIAFCILVLSLHAWLDVL